MPIPLFGKDLKNYTIKVGDSVSIELPKAFNSHNDQILVNVDFGLASVLIKGSFPRFTAHTDSLSLCGTY